MKGRCTGCGRAVVSARPVAATGVLTPSPVASGVSSPDADVTRLPDVRSVLDPANAPTIGPGGPARETVLPADVDDPTYLLRDIRTSPATGPLAIGQRFGPRYQIIRLRGDRQ